MLSRVQARSDSVICTLQPLNARLNTLYIELLSNQRFRFGRHEDCEQAFPSEKRISSLHASLILELREDGSPCVAIEDSSVNGTFVNAERVPKGRRRRLQTGDEIYLVIPSQELLHQTGYEGSLMGKFIGYSFAYSSEAEIPGHAQRTSASADSASSLLGSMGDTDPTAASGAPGSALQQMRAAIAEHQPAVASPVPNSAPLGVRPPPLAVESPSSDASTPAPHASSPVVPRGHTSPPPRTQRSRAASVELAGYAPPLADSPLLRRMRELATQQLPPPSGAGALPGGAAPHSRMIRAVGPSGELPPAVSFALWWDNQRAVEAARPAWEGDAADIQARHLVGSPWRMGS
jgi:predicted component of type VI protein secretion system